MLSPVEAGLDFFAKADEAKIGVVPANEQGSAIRMHRNQAQA
jgi:hypothetical protein